MESGGNYLLLSRSLIFQGGVGGAIIVSVRTPQCSDRDSMRHLKAGAREIWVLGHKGRKWQSCVTQVEVL